MKEDTISVIGLSVEVEGGKGVWSQVSWDGVRDADAAASTRCQDDPIAVTDTSRVRKHVPDPSVPGPLLIHRITETIDCLSMSLVNVPNRKEYQIRDAVTVARCDRRTHMSHMPLWWWRYLRFKCLFIQRLAGRMTLINGIVVALWQIFHPIDLRIEHYELLVWTVISLRGCQKSGSWRAWRQEQEKRREERYEWVTRLMPSLLSVHRIWKNDFSILTPLTVLFFRVKSISFHTSYSFHSLFSSSPFSPPLYRHRFRFTAFDRSQESIQSWRSPGGSDWLRTMASLMTSDKFSSF